MILSHRNDLEFNEATRGSTIEQWGKQCTIILGFLVQNVGFLVCSHYGFDLSFLILYPKNGPARMRKKTNNIRKKTNNKRKNAQDFF